MLRSIAGALAPVTRTAVRPVRLQPPSLCKFSRSFGSTSGRNNEKDAPPTPASDTQEGQQQQSQAEASPRLSDTSVQSSGSAEAVEATAEGVAPPKRAASTSNLDDILGAVSAVALPGSQAEVRGEEEESFRPAENTPMVRGVSRYAQQTSDPSAGAHKLHVQSSRNNTIITLTAPNGDPLAAASGGSVGFKHTQRSGYEAGYRAAFAVFEKINKFKDSWRILHLEIFWNGFGQGREAVFRALLSDNGSTTKSLVSRMTDKTPIKVGGVRPKKRRML